MADGEADPAFPGDEARTDWESEIAEAPSDTCPSATESDSANAEGLTTEELRAEVAKLRSEMSAMKGATPLGATAK